MELINIKKRDKIKKFLSMIAGGAFLVSMFATNPINTTQNMFSDKTTQTVPGVKDISLHDTTLPKMNIIKNSIGEIIQINELKF